MSQISDYEKRTRYLVELMETGITGSGSPHSDAYNEAVHRALRVVDWFVSDPDAEPNGRDVVAFALTAQPVLLVSRPDVSGERHAWPLYRFSEIRNEFELGEIGEAVMLTLSEMTPLEFFNLTDFFGW